MNENKKRISKPILIASAAAVAVIAVFAGVKIKAATVAEDETDLSSLTWEEVCADPEKYGTNPDALDDLYLGKTEGGVCTHDETFSEPKLPDGKYYPNGDASADYYLEISGDKMCFRSSDGSPYETQNQTWYGEHEYRIITDHYTDISMLCADWTDFEKPEGCPLLDKYRPASGVQTDFDENGNAHIHLLDLDERTEKDMQNDVTLSIPE